MRTAERKVHATPDGRPPRGWSTVRSSTYYTALCPAAVNDPQRFSSDEDRITCKACRALIRERRREGLPWPADPAARRPPGPKEETA